MPNKSINTDNYSLRLREKAIDLDQKKILVTRFQGSKQEEDLTVPSNCNGFGRIRHFKLHADENWPINPLPILPAAKALNLRPEAEVRAQVFQSSVCNWRCWYCFVDYKLLSGNSKYSSLLSSDELLDLYLDQDNPPRVIDLSGGQPDLTPEWVPWMMEALTQRGLDKEIFLWSDDNLSNDYLWKFLDDSQLELLANYEMYSRVCCFKGINEESFSLNTKAEPKLFNRQFALCQDLLQLGIDLYCYVTLTASSRTNFSEVIPHFLDKLQAIDEQLPLRVVPLKIFEFTPVKSRLNDQFKDMLKGQLNAIEVWNMELSKRYNIDQLNLPITEIQLCKK